jgi:hypothetical protein
MINAKSGLDYQVFAERKRARRQNGAGTPLAVYLAAFGVFAKPDFIEA